MNLIPHAKIPYKTAVGTVYDSGDFAGLLDKALALADYANFPKRKRAATKRGKYRGISVSCMLEIAGGNPMEEASITFTDSDSIALGCNVQSTGQSHATVFAQLLADQLGIDAARVKHSHGDTAMGLTGFASVGSRSAMSAGNAIAHTADMVIDKGKKVASALLEASESDIQYRDGAFTVLGTDRKLSLFDVARRAREAASGKADIPATLDSKGRVEIQPTFPNGCHIAEIEIDPQTGILEIASYVVVDDPGRVLNHTVVEGQIHGGMAQGIGQALVEQAVYDSESGQLVTGSFMDYGMPHADLMPHEIREASHSVPATSNRLGVKGTGEAGTTASLAAVMNAIADAIPNGAADYMEMPATAGKIWEACQRAMKAS
jgi:carbon-monoxide dehydrogenase large subunit